MTAASLQSRVLVSHAAPEAFAPGTRAILARLGYAIFEPEAYASHAGEEDRPDCYLVDERSLGEIPDDGGSPVPIVALTGRHGVSGADPRIVGAVRRPAGLHEIYRVLQQVLEATPRSTPRVPTHLAAHCRSDGKDWRVAILSLSENGCLLRSPEELLLGARLELEFGLPRSGRLVLGGDVAYQIVPDVGVVFHAALPKQRRAIADYVTEALTTLPR